MLKQLVSLLVLLATCSAALFPTHEVAARDPRSFDLLYSSASGALNETWLFALPATLSAVIIASQVFNFSSGGLWPGGTYDEELQVLVYETALANNAADEETRLVGAGSFSGPAHFGRELRVDVRTPRGADVPMRQFFSSYSGYSYTFSFVFGSVGFYPWYNSLTLSDYSPVHQNTNRPGLAMGIAFSRS